jgi:hypothetical protein
MSYNDGHQIGNTPVGNFVKTFLEGTFEYCWIAKLFPPILMFTIVQNRCGKVLFLVSLGVNVYSWEIVGLDLVNGLNKSRTPFHHYY